MPDRQKILNNLCQKLVKSNEIKQFHEKDRGNTYQEEKRKKKTDPMICVISRVFFNFSRPNYQKIHKKI